MLLCNKKTAVISAALLLSFTSGIFAQSASTSKPAAPVTPVMPVSPVMPVTDVKMPEMPSFSSTSSRFYKPEQKTKTTKTQAPSSPEVPSQPSVVTSSANTNTASVLPASLNNLTAADLTSLAKQGSLSNLTSLLGGNLSGVPANGQNQNLVLNQILKELNEIKANQKSLTTEDYAKMKPSAEPPAIRRFVINNNDILRNCNAVFFSNPEADGSFLLTGDCKMLYNNQTLSETFYMFFKNKGTSNGHQVYEVEISLSQNSLNKNSVLYQFCQLKDLTAQKTGNLITLRASNANVRSDMLLDIGK
ncbi:hypothetical protein [Treponema sp.]|uniref:hypothetical protein n=1 Tax=Treponema sp. TaxID=166 RepID=UPI00298D84FB|nr:hypothetical protein [Treponema sp.]